MRFKNQWKINFTTYHDEFANISSRDPPQGKGVGLGALWGPSLSRVISPWCFLDRIASPSIVEGIQVILQELVLHLPRYKGWLHNGSCLHILFHQHCWSKPTSSACPPLSSHSLEENPNFSPRNTSTGFAVTQTTLDISGAGLVCGPHEFPEHPSKT